MKSPNELKKKLARQWQNPDIREKRLLNPGSWPVRLSIGKPTGRMLVQETSKVKAHLDQWRKVNTGRVHWQDMAFKAAEDLLSIPVGWELQTPSEWIAATETPEIKNEFTQLEELVEACDPRFRKLFIRQRHLINGKSTQEIIQAARLAMELEPGCARGKPLRTLSLVGIDSKFFERNRTLMSKLLDIRFERAAGDMGLEAFLDALDENDHWLLLADLDQTLLPFSQQRVRAKELLQTSLPGTRVIVVENEKCLYHLPPLKNTLAILGAGLNLAWLEGTHFSNKQLAYWGDIDTWGLMMLANARNQQPGITPMLMTDEIFDQYATHAVTEKTTAFPIAPQGLTMAETTLYNKLLLLAKNRLEQEFLPASRVHEAVRKWWKQS